VALPLPAGYSQPKEIVENAVSGHGPIRSHAGRLSFHSLPLAGTLDGDPGVRATCHIFVGSKARFGLPF
jgi:hypothetical protein